MSSDTVAVLELMGLFSLFFAIAIYVYISLTYYKLFVKAGVKNPWLAWIPIAQFWPYMWTIRKSAWNLAWVTMFVVGLFPVLLMHNIVGILIGIILFIAPVVLAITWSVKFLNAFGMKGWWLLLVLVPYVGSMAILVLYGYMAFSKQVQYRY